MKDKDSQLLWEAYLARESDDVASRTPPRNKKNKGDFLPKHVRDEINDEAGEEEDEEGIEETTHSEENSCKDDEYYCKTDHKCKKKEGVEDSVSMPSGYTDTGTEELSLQEVFSTAIEMDQSLPQEKKGDDYQEVRYNLISAVNEFISEVEIKMHN